ncbi:helix-turn-helix domain-containing protein [Glaciimonas sp. PAMC28666]|uniref:helix-turn-helix domain-containing protein n=1 Tax=Glaciimonas sp. PAMC28666 TaxID=2807626 RepID=UPI001963070B|nr:helix-turn-helix transcriptional regulator [Glaciimonas sp. PAMC28666]QRX81641.1 helix-turn-helix transcriptional regulator [Glaciimonas sp. PAMC28666]
MNSLKKEVGKRLKEARNAKKLTLEATSLLVPGLSTTRLSNWENGTRSSDLKIVKKLAEVYEASASYMLTLEDAPPDPRLRHLIELYKAADSRGQDTILRVAESESTYEVTKKTQGQPMQLVNPALRLGTDSKKE